MCLLLLLKTVCLCTSCRHADDEQTVPSQIAMKSRASWVKISPSRTTLVRQEDGARQYDGGPGIRTPKRSRAAVFKFSRAFCVWLRLALSGCVSGEKRRELLRLVACGCVCLRVYVPKNVPKVLAGQGSRLVARGS